MSYQAPAPFVLPAITPMTAPAAQSPGPSLDAAPTAPNILPTDTAPTPVSSSPVKNPLTSPVAFVTTRTGARNYGQARAGTSQFNPNPPTHTPHAMALPQNN